ncbi:uncharacterized protein PAS_chr4_1001 [Komagataella phaffii GS115]|uniref:Alpha box domain-containing protein n=2 Tax=Komagataella phaffii TaxID=460519 RepID=C4R974_KOMPG|nr:uncharacterized protein PAS_chr4_1001 [Komagataella phaffii GS115]CAY72149.1 hypothetical protein PAS_chr4_1001 [Komagataella phaffii GS115]
MSKRINAFIAFRSYYSRQVNDYNKQISISRLLSVAWKNENKELWRSYALLYNSSNSNIPFVDWLQTKGPKNSKRTSTVTKSFISWNELLSTRNKIEDVFLDLQ